MPLVSVGIPAYNRPDGLRQTLDLITRQTYQNLEIIISDNCSPGNETENIAKEYIRRDPRILYYRQEENKGAAFNFRFVLDQASGEYFMWAADDDGWSLDAIEKYVNKFNTSPSLHLVFSNVEIVDESGISQNIIEFNKLGVKKQNKYITFKNASFNMRFTCWFYGLFRREYLKEIEPDITSEFGSDYMIIMREILNDAYDFVPLPLFKYTIYQEHTSIRYDTEELGRNYRRDWKWTSLMIKCWKKIILSENLSYFDKFFSTGYLLIQLVWSIDSDIALNLTSRLLEKRTG